MFKNKCSHKFHNGESAIVIAKNLDMEYPKKHTAYCVLCEAQFILKDKKLVSCENRRTQ
jgi:hypothetical protein